MSRGLALVLLATSTACAAPLPSAAPTPAAEPTRPPAALTTVTPGASPTASRPPARTLAASPTEAAPYVFVALDRDAAGTPRQPNTTGVRYSDQVNKANANVHRYRLHQRDIEVYVEREGILTEAEEKERADWCAEAWLRVWEIFGGYAFPTYECVISDRLADAARGSSGIVPWSRFPASTLKRSARWKALMAHEVFHAWNFGHMPFETLWIVEGMGQYYNDLVLGPSELSVALAGYVRGYRDAKQAGKDLALATIQRGNDALAYTKGALVWYMIDVEVSQRSGGAKSLDNVLRHLYLRYGPKGIPPGTRPPAWSADVVREALVAEVGAADFFARFFTDHVDGTADLFAWRDRWLEQRALPIPAHPKIPYAK